VYTHPHCLKLLLLLFTLLIIRFSVCVHVPAPSYVSHAPASASAPPLLSPSLLATSLLSPSPPFPTTHPTPSTMMTDTMSSFHGIEAPSSAAVPDTCVLDMMGEESTHGCFLLHDGSRVNVNVTIDPDLSCAQVFVDDKPVGDKLTPPMFDDAFIGDVRCFALSSCDFAVALNAEGIENKLIATFRKQPDGSYLSKSCVVYDLVCGAQLLKSRYLISLVYAWSWVGVMIQCNDLDDDGKLMWTLGLQYEDEGCPEVLAAVSGGYVKVSVGSTETLVDETGSGGVPNFRFL
jgi:hypothetical protein